jgi:hypothetical protein
MQKKAFSLIIIIIILLSFPNIAYNQVDNWSTQPTISAYFTPLKLNRYTRSSGNISDEVYSFNNTNISLSFPINEKFKLGVGLNAVSIRVLREPVDRAFVSEFFFQYNFRVQRKLGVYLEGGYAVGNLCSCGDAEIYSDESMNHFIPIGFGLNYPLFEKLHLKAGFKNYRPIKKTNSDLYNWTQPFIGVNFYFYENYRTPFTSYFFKRDKIIPKEKRNRFWVDKNIRKWNVGISSSGIRLKQTNELSGQTSPLRDYAEFSVVPRVNYWLNQAILVGLQATFYQYKDNYNFNIPKTNGFGYGAQFRVYPLALKNTQEFRALNIGKRGNWNFSPIVGVEFRAANFSWFEPELAGEKWEYFDFQPNAGFVLAYKRVFNLFWSIGPTIGLKKINPTNVVIVGLEYNIIEKY